MRVAVVEDDQELLKTICDVLESEGHEPIPFAVVDAITGPTIAQAHPDVLVADVQVPGDGFSLADEFLKRPHPPIVFMVGMDDPFDLQQHGAVAVLHKPFNSEELIQTIAEVASNKWRKPLHLQR